MKFPLFIILFGSVFSTRLSNRARRSKPVVQQITAPLDHAEGPYWDTEKQLLFFVDIAGQRVYCYNPATKMTSFAHVSATVGAVIPILESGNRFLIGRGTDLAMLTWNGLNTTNPIIHTLATVDTDIPGNRFNDGKADAIGRLWIGTMGVEEPVGTVAPNRGTLYRTGNHSCQLESVLRGVSISNGIAWSLNNKRMYFIDSPTRRVDVYDYNLLTADISNRRVLFDFKSNNVSGVPDGMTVDFQGNLWIACWGGSQVINVNSLTGKLITSIALPVERVTSLTFGGPLYDTLYVTTMRTGLSKAELKKQPSAGAVFLITNLPTRGLYNVPARDCINIPISA